MSSQLVDRRVGDLLVLAALLIFSLHNVIAYDPTLGYDGRDHLFLVHSVAETGQMPLAAYGGSNPPLYYLIAGGVFRVTHSDKCVQFLSWIFFLLQVLLLRSLLLRFIRRRWLVNLLLVFYSVLPLTVEYSVMVMNYSLGNFLTILGLFLFMRLIESPKPSRAMVVGLIVTVIAGVLVSLTGLAIWAAAFPVLWLWIPAPAPTRFRFAGLLLLVSLIVLGGWAVHRQRRVGCVLCTLHRSGGAKATVRLLDPRDYFRVSGQAMPAWNAPYYPNGFGKSLPLTLFETFFGDYFNFLIPGYLASNPAKRKDWVFTGLHYLDPLRQWQLRVLNYLAIPVFLCFLCALFLRGGRGGQSRLSDLKRALWLFSFLTVAQFLVYIHRYRDMVNWHSGYLYPLAFLGCLLVGRQLDMAPSQARLAAPFIALYSAFSFWVFWL